MPRKFPRAPSCRVVHFETGRERYMRGSSTLPTSSHQRHAVAYATQRARETRRAYLVTKMGHALVADPHNRRLAEKELLGVFCVAYPPRRR